MEAGNDGEEGGCEDDDFSPRLGEIASLSLHFARQKREIYHNCHSHTATEGQKRVSLFGRRKHAVVVVVSTRHVLTFLPRPSSSHPHPPPPPPLAVVVVRQNFLFPPAVLHPPPSLPLPPAHFAHLLFHQRERSQGTFFFLSLFHFFRTFPSTVDSVGPVVSGNTAAEKKPPKLY